MTNGKRRARKAILQLPKQEERGAGEMERKKQSGQRREMGGCDAVDGVQTKKH